MGIKGLCKEMGNLMKKQSKVQVLGHNIIDFSNIVYKRILSVTESLGKENKVLTSDIKLRILLSFCADIQRKATPKNQFYIVLDPMNNSNKKIDIKLTDYNKSIKQYNRLLEYNKEKNTLYLYSIEPRTLLASYDINTHNRQAKPKRIQNSIQTQQNVLQVPVYNYIIISQFFKKNPNVKILHSAFNADQTIGILISQLLKQKVSINDITIQSFDSDMIIYGQGAMIQYGRQQYLLHYPQLNRYVFMCGCEYFKGIISYHEFSKMDILCQQEFIVRQRQQHLTNNDMAYVFSELLYVYFDSIVFQEKQCLYTILGKFTLNTAIVNYLLFHQGNLHVSPKTLDNLYANYINIMQTYLPSIKPMAKKTFVSATYTQMKHTNFIRFFSPPEQIVYNFYSEYFTDTDIKNRFAKHPNTQQNYQLSKPQSN